MPIYLGQGTTQPLDVIMKLNGEFVSLIGATVTFTMMDARYWSGQQEDVSPTLKVDTAACTLPNGVGEDGTVRWSPTTGNTDTTGKFSYQYTITYASGKIEKFPRDPRDDYIEITPSLDAIA